MIGKYEQFFFRCKITIEEVTLHIDEAILSMVEMRRLTYKSEISKRYIKQSKYTHPSYSYDRRRYSAVAARHCKR